jgi:hypothetical protein
MQLGIGSQIQHPAFGAGTIVDSSADYYKIYFRALGELKEIAADFTGMQVSELVEPVATQVSMQDLEAALENIFWKMEKTEEIVHLGGKWAKGRLVLQPNDKTLQSKEIPIDNFFHKIVMLRDRLRVLEQNINSHSKLDDEDKVHMQQYITRCYGSLTTFNILFRDSWQQFKGDSKNE